MHSEDELYFPENKLFFPLFIDLNEKKIVIAGAGAVACRRAAALLDFCSRITVIAPEVCPEIEAMAAAGRLTLKRRCFEAEDAAGAFLVLAATGSAEANQQIIEECRRRGIPVNHAGDKNLCDFYFPAIVRRDTLVAGLSSCGTDHSRVREMREVIEKSFDKSSASSGV